MEAKHSPAPWNFNVTDSTYFFDVMDSSGEFVTLIEHAHDASEANARLIAAAPEMLEALQMIIRHGLFEGDGYETVLKKTWAVIEKATEGGQE